MISRKIREMKRILKEDEFEARAFIWEQLDYQVELECSEQIIQRAMSTINYHKCVAYRKEWINEKTARRRVECITVMLNRYSDKKKWNRVRFSDEVHFEWDSQDKLFIIRQSVERYCQDCIQHTDKSDAKDVKRHHCWAAVNHDFKSNIHFYQMSDNLNEKMSQRVYIDQILKFIIKSWLNHDFVLKEDDDSGYDSSKSNIVRTWKETHYLKSYFNCASSPD
jgi:hypothetical protein